jgi:hypothetical protein
MSGEHPLKGSGVFFAFLLGCYGSTLTIAALPAAHAGEATAQQQGEMIPQDEVVVQGEPTIGDGPITYSLRIYKEPDRIKLKGSISSEEEYKTLMGLVKANFPTINLSDRIKIDEKAPDGEVKIGGLSFALKLLGYVETGQASVDNHGLYLEGSANTAVVLTEIEKLVKEDKPAGVPIKNLRVAPPKKSWNASIKPEDVLRITGVAASEKQRLELQQFAKEKFSWLSIVDETVVDSSLSDEWGKVARRSIELLVLLNHGSVEVTEQAVHLKGHAPSDKALQSIDAIGTNLPGGVALRSEVSAPASLAEGVAAIPTPAIALPQ